MTDTAHSADSGPVVALFCTRGMETFLSNAIQGILQAGIEAGRIYVGCPNNTLKSVRDVARLHSIQIQVISNQKLSERQSEMETYRSFGSREFTDISWKKIFFIRQLLEHHAHVVYADLDVSWIRNPLPYLTEVALVYPMAFQTEGLPRFPPAVCCGFASFAKSERTVAFLDALIELYSSQVNSDNRLDDQAACQRLIENDVTWLHDIYCLPETLFLNGLGYRSLQNAGENPCRMEGELLPFLFHANWTIGLDNKCKLLADTGTWLIGDNPQMGRTALTRGSPMETASDNQPLTEPAPLLTVIYPVYDVRGDVIERLRLWTEKQDLEPHRYTVFVVAGAEADLDEASIRKVLRPHDIILRAHGTAGEPEYWNAGALRAATPWLLFTEGHSMPKPGCLSALAAWIKKNPDGEAINFKVENVDAHRVAALLKRWFALIHTHWGEPSNWRRLHRTAFVLSRGVYAEVGPFDAQLGHFAPQLFSARMHQRGRSISLLPTSSVIHDDSREMSAHHRDTADYARGEMDARVSNHPEFFERYFGSSPIAHPSSNLPRSYARNILAGILVATWHKPRNVSRFAKQALRFVAPAMIGLHYRVKILDMLNRADEFVIMHLPLTENFRWNRFLSAHRRTVQIEQMLWVARHDSPPLQIRDENDRLPIDKIDPQSMIGIHALEYIDDATFRWTRPVFLLRLALCGDGTLTLETRNVRRGISLSDIAVVVGGRMVSSEDLALDDAGNIKFNIEATSASHEIDVVVMVRELCEPASENGRGRRLGLPLFSVGFECGNSSALPSRP
jgi:hypothetical protein